MISASRGQPDYLPSGIFKIYLLPNRIALNFNKKKNSARCLPTDKEARRLSLDLTLGQLGSGHIPFSVLLLGRRLIRTAPIPIPRVQSHLHHGSAGLGISPTYTAWVSDDLKIRPPLGHTRSLYETQTHTHAQLHNFKKALFLFETASICPVHLGHKLHCPAQVALAEEIE